MEQGPYFDPFDAYGLDSDPVPKRLDVLEFASDDMRLVERYAHHRPIHASLEIAMSVARDASGRLWATMTSYVPAPGG